jgi:hypothetical protein
MEKLIKNILAISFLVLVFPAFSYDTIPISPYGLEKDKRCNPIYLKEKVEDFLVEIDSLGFFHHKKNKKRLMGQGRFVMDGSGNIFYISILDQAQLEKKLGKPIFHSSFLNGGPISMAGLLKFFDEPGILTEVNNGSGHYRPPFSMMKNFDNEIKKRGVKYPYDRINVGTDWVLSESQISNNSSGSMPRNCAP